MSAKVPSPRDTGFRLAGFPKELERNFFETLDKRYYIILLTLFVSMYGFAILMAFQDWQLSEDQINKLKQRVIEKVYDVEFVIPDAPPQEEEPTLVTQETAVPPKEEKKEEEKPEEEISEKTKERLEESQVEKKERRKRSQEDLEKRAKEMQKEVASQGILAIATAAGGSGSGNVAYSDVLKDLDGGSGVNDISKVVEGTAGIRTANYKTDKTRAAKGAGSRKGGKGTGIDDLISEEAMSNNSRFARKGDLKLTSKNIKLTAGLGSRNPEELTASINKQSALIEYCYKQRAKINPNLRGRIDLEIEIAPKGRVTRARIIRSTLNDKKLNSCILRNIRRWRFGAVKTGLVKIRVPFIF